jgi:hypothetical protein
MQPPCSEAGLASLRIRTKRELGCVLPDGYCALLRRVDGLDWNGLVVYASERQPLAGASDGFIEGLVEGNLDFRDHEPMKEYLVFADDGVVLFTHNTTSNRYEVILRVGLTLLESFDSFDELLNDALAGHL